MSAGNIARLKVSYWEGWHEEKEVVVGPLSTSRAARRDQLGEPYSVLLTTPDDRPVAVFDVAWRDLYCGARFFDGRDRCVCQLDSRLLEDKLLCVIEGVQEWFDPAKPETAEAAARQLLENYPHDDEGVSVLVSDSHEEKMRRYLPSRDECWIRVPEEFGDWGPFVRRFRFALDLAGWRIPESVTVEDVSAPSGTGLPAHERPWRPPRPAQPPEYLDVLFTPGIRFEIHGSSYLGREGRGEGDERALLIAAVSGIDTTVAIDVRDAGTLRMPTGRLVTEDIDQLRHQNRAFTVGVPPGTYPVRLAVLDWPGDPGPPVVAAAKLVIRDAPAATWEMALLPDDDPRIFHDGVSTGFCAEYSGAACMLDYDALPSMALSRSLDCVEFEDGPSTELDDPETGANLIAYDSGYSLACITWIGRDADSNVVCYLTDTGVLGYATVAAAGPLR